MSRAEPATLVRPSSAYFRPPSAPNYRQLAFGGVESPCLQLAATARRRLLAGRTPHSVGHTRLSAPKKESSRSAAQRGVGMFFRADELWQTRPLPAANLRRAHTASPRLPGAMAPNASGSGVPGQLIDGCCRDEGRVARDLPRDQQSPPSAERDTGRAVSRPWRRRGEARCSTTASLSAY